MWLLAPASRLDSVVLVVGDDQMAVCSERDVERSIKLAWAGAVLANRTNEAAVLREDLDPIVLVVSDDDVAFRSYGNAGRLG